MRSVLDARAALAKGFSLASFSHSLKCSCNRTGAMLLLCQGSHLTVRLLGCLIGQCPQVWVPEPLLHRASALLIATLLTIRLPAPLAYSHR